MNLQKPVTIVVSVYNALPAVLRLLESLSETLKKTSAQLILVDDASTNRRIEPLLFEYEKMARNVRVIRNQQNLGYTRSVQLGVDQSAPKTDIVLLNSDTVVFGDWLGALQQEAYKSAKIASVMPLTNNCHYASLINWPRGGQISIKKAATINVNLRRLKSAQSFEVASSFGFCMYIKRSALNKIGGFNLVQFPRGYGEEVDWCFRGRTLGFTHRLTSAAFVYHYGTQSFSEEEKKRNNKRANRILSFSYPEFYRDYKRETRNEQLQAWIRNIQKEIGID